MAQWHSRSLPYRFHSTFCQWCGHGMCVVGPNFNSLFAVWSFPDSPFLSYIYIYPRVQGFCRHKPAIFQGFFSTRRLLVVSSWLCMIAQVEGIWDQLHDFMLLRSSPLLPPCLHATGGIYSQLTRRPLRWSVSAPPFFLLFCMSLGSRWECQVSCVVLLWGRVPRPALWSVAMGGASLGAVSCPPARAHGRGGAQGTLPPPDCYCATLLSADV